MSEELNEHPKTIRFKAGNKIKYGQDFHYHTGIPSGVEFTTQREGDRILLVGPGYGERGNYGNGVLYPYGSTLDELMEQADVCLTGSDLMELVDKLKLEAQMNAQEARTANATIAEIYQAVTGSTGEPGNWHGAKPVVEELGRLREEVEALNQRVQELEGGGE